jgi:hypothetical protein
MMTVDSFFRRWNKNPMKLHATDNSVSVRFEAPTGCALEQLLNLAHKAGASLGTWQTGVYEIQTDEGIWALPNGKALRHKMHAAVFTPWEEVTCS